MTPPTTVQKKQVPTPPQRASGSRLASSSGTASEDFLFYREVDVSKMVFSDIDTKSFSQGKAGPPGGAGGFRYGGGQQGFQSNSYQFQPNYPQPGQFAPPSGMGHPGFQPQFNQGFNQGHYQGGPQFSTQGGQGSEYRVSTINYLYPDGRTDRLFMTGPEMMCYGLSNRKKEEKYYYGLTFYFSVIKPAGKAFAAKLDEMRLRTGKFIVSSSKNVDPLMQERPASAVRSVYWSGTPGDPIKLITVKVPKDGHTPFVLQRKDTDPMVEIPLERMFRVRTRVKPIFHPDDIYINGAHTQIRVRPRVIIVREMKEAITNEIARPLMSRYNQRHPDAWKTAEESYEETTKRIQDDEGNKVGLATNPMPNPTSEGQMYNLSGNQGYPGSNPTGGYPAPPNPNAEGQMYNQSGSQGYPGSNPVGNWPVPNSSSEGQTHSVGNQNGEGNFRTEEDSAI